ncbi:hypothetical protein GCM10017779_43530 [Streptomyces capillispiralis]|nr:hypothetical protein GCM10017779_43530 [Streptomyces capillispiralis]
MPSDGPDGPRGTPPPLTKPSTAFRYDPSRTDCRTVRGDTEPTPRERLPLFTRVVRGDGGTVAGERHARIAHPGTAAAPS